MDINELMKEIRKKEGYSQQEMADKIGVSKNMIFMIEKKERNVSEDLLNKLVNSFSKYEKKILQVFYENKLAAKLLDENIGSTVEKVKYREFEYRTYIFDTKSDGLIDKKKTMQYKEERDIDTGNKILNECIVLKIVNDGAQPFFFDGDIIAFLKTNFENWQSLDKKAIIVQIDKELYIKKLIFEDGEPFLYPFDIRLHKKIKVNELKNIKYIARAQYRLNINLDKFSL